MKSRSQGCGLEEFIEDVIQEMFHIPEFGLFEECSKFPKELVDCNGEVFEHVHAMWLIDQPSKQAAFLIFEMEFGHFF